MQFATLPDLRAQANRASQPFSKRMPSWTRRIARGRGGKDAAVHPFQKVIVCLAADRLQCQRRATPVYRGIENLHMTNLAPETRASLLLRIRDPADQAAWHEFVEIYRPVILRLAFQKGIQEADADDVAQKVLVAVAKSVEQREHDPRRAKFRTWLNRVARNAILNALTRGRPDRGSGGSALVEVLDQQASRCGPDSDLLRLEHRREVFRWAVRQVRKEFHQDTWDAFRLTAVEGRTVEAVAEALMKNPGAIYAARSRVIRRIQEKVTEYEQES